MRVRRVVTGHDRDGKAVFASDQQVDPLRLALMPGAEFHRLWGADQAPIFPDEGGPTAQPSYFPPVGGYRFGFFTVPPGTAPAPAGLDLQAALAEMEDKLPGLLAYLEPDNPGMHTHRHNRLRGGPVRRGDPRAGRWDREGAPPGRHRGAERDAPPLGQPGNRASRPGGIPHRGPPRQQVIGAPVGPRPGYDQS